jgi:hypothetical protein
VTVYVIKLRAGNGVDDIRALKWLLKRLWRSFGMKCIGIGTEATNA